ncbi:hypothetical protein CAPTEDRAFT_104399 [Capitella teleta]|uniref:G-protein coupled receptors family 1 profile domain-containing protein n=1 Tax=Capitella teleta TaxID=283909 RepID=R7V8X0_CAPTE|nr:hypothetical protein CAPTEDRAFT_104399 [Capitella teleta]|eukprot:ELU15288.1 hypothetical protein CAPTEDRAFT_104399 [Capitella teleta]
MGIRLPGILCFLGIVGNLLALLVLSRDTSRSASLMSLKALALSDLILLVCAVVQQIVPLWCLEALSRDALCLHQGFLRVYSWPVLCAAQMASIWFTVLVSAERFIAICRPLSAPRLCTFSRVRTSIITITLASVFFNVVKFFEFETLPEFTPELNATRFILSPTWLRQDQIYRYLYNTVLFCLVIYALPLSVLTVLNVKIVRRIKQARKEWQLLNRSQKREMKATTLPLVIVLVYFICGTQSLLSFILDAVFVDFSPWLQIYTAFVNLLVIFNSAVNFFLMYCFGSRFRRLLKDTLCCTRVDRHNSFHSSSQRMLPSK